jgi:PAS domain S-box-containing protein
VRPLAGWRLLTKTLYERIVTGYAMFAVSADGHVMSWNAGAQNTFGYTPAEIIRKPLDIIFSREAVAAGEPARELASALSGTQNQHDRWHVRKDGTRFWGINTVEPIFDEAHKLLGFTKLVRDITQAHAVAEAAADSEQRLRMLSESVGDTAIFTIDSGGIIRSWNCGAQAIFGYANQDILNRPFSVLFGADAG